MEWLRVILVFVLLVIGVVISYILGRTAPKRCQGKIVIQDSDDPEYAGKVQFVFEDEIDDIIKLHHVTMLVENQMSKKYSSSNAKT